MWDSLTRTLLALTFVTGILDAVSFIALGQVFAAMQTGNVIFLGLGIGGAPGAPLLAPLIALAAFLVGGLGAALLARPASPGAAGLRFALAVEVGLLGAAALLAALVEVEPKQTAAYVLIALLALAMGLRNTVARQLGDPNLATTVLNLTLTAFASHTPTGFASQAEMKLRGAAIAAILAGAICGALLLEASLALAIAAAAVIVLALALSTGGLGRRRTWERSAPAPSR
jgi:uncharacterized membrane protein YoaK (UPF0700 family)